jgi:hypothetical protein
VLYGVFPAVLLGAGLSWAYMRWRCAPLAKLVAGQAAGETNVVLKDVYRFKDVYEVRGWGQWREGCERVRVANAAEGTIPLQG